MERKVEEIRKRGLRRITTDKKDTSNEKSNCKLHNQLYLDQSIINYNKHAVAKNISRNI